MGDLSERVPDETIDELAAAGLLGPSDVQKAKDAERALFGEERK